MSSAFLADVNAMLEHRKNFFGIGLVQRQNRRFQKENAFTAGALNTTAPLSGSCAGSHP